METKNTEDKGRIKSIDPIILLGIFSIAVFLIQVFIKGQIFNPLELLPQPVILFTLCTVIGRTRYSLSNPNDLKLKYQTTGNYRCFIAFSAIIALFFFAGLYSNATNRGNLFRDSTIISTILSYSSIILVIPLLHFVEKYNPSMNFLKSQQLKRSKVEKLEIWSILSISLVLVVSFNSFFRNFFISSNSDALMGTGIFSLFFIFIGHVSNFFQGTSRSPYSLRTNLMLWGVLAGWLISNIILINVTGDPFLCVSLRGICEVHPTTDDLITTLLIAPVFEEFIFTMLPAAFMRNYKSSLSNFFSWLANFSILFAMMHYNQYIDPRTRWFLPIIALQKTCEILIYLTSNNVALPILFHGSFNFISPLLGPIPAAVIFFGFVICFFVINKLSHHSSFNFVFQNSDRSRSTCKTQ